MGHFRYYSFWIEHILPMLGVFYMTFVHGFRPDFRKVYKPFAMLSVLAVFAIYANLHIPDANYMYLAAGTPGDSLANVLPSNIWVRLVVCFGIVCVLFALVSLPQIIREIKQKRAQKEKTPA
ncbi:MAG: YwaF family protein [Clostridia bacterium]|nr:YwaF family protein [Clostridia bacterium]